VELPWDGHGPDYDMTAEGRHRGTHYGPKCPGCGIHTEASEGFTCWIPDCPCAGLAADSRESAECAARYARRELSGRAAARTMTADEAYDALESRARLDYLLSVEFVHRDLP
jgi:hypothetical protein